MTRLSNRTLVSLLFLLVLSAPALAQQGLSVSGRVFLDLNRNGTANAGEPGLAGVSVSLTGTDTDGHAVSLLTTTDSGGGYSFTGLLPSLSPGYILTETQPNGYGSSTPNTLSVTLVDVSVSGRDFGDTAASIAGAVFADANNNGAVDPGDVGIAGVTVTLTGTDANGTPVSLVTTTGAGGDYLFGGLLAGIYTLAETQPAGWLDGSDAAGTAGGTLGNDVVGGINLGAGVIAIGYTFGELPLGYYDFAIPALSGPGLVGMAMVFAAIGAFLAGRQKLAR